MPDPNELTLETEVPGPRVRELFSVRRLLSLFEHVGDFSVRVP